MGSKLVRLLCVVMPCLYGLRKRRSLVSKGIDHSKTKVTDDEKWLCGKSNILINCVDWLEKRDKNPQGPLERLIFKRRNGRDRGGCLVKWEEEICIIKYEGYTMNGFGRMTKKEE
jgi:hypothetical protein